MSFLKEHAMSNPVVAGVSAAAPKEKGLFSTIMDNVAGGAEGVIGGGLDYIGAQLKRFDEAGRESSYVDSIRNSDEGTLGKWGDSFINNGEYLNDKAAKNFAESGTLDKYQDMSIIDRLTSADYLTDKRGLLADFSQMAGSAIPFAAASAAAPFGGAGALAARGIGSMAARAGAKQIGKAIMSKAGQQAGASAAKWALGTGPLEAATNAGGMYADLKDEGLSDDEIARRMNSMIKEELPMDMLTQGIMGPILEGKGFKPIFKRGGRPGKIAGYGVNIPGSAASEYAQEMTQQQAQNKWSGKPYGTFFNPTEDEQQAGRAAFMGSLPLGLFGGGHTAYRDYKARINRMNNEAAKSNPNNPFNGMEETAGNKTEIADVPESTVTVQRGNANNGGSDKEAFFKAIEMQESGGDPDAVSSTGARGVYQIQPENWDAWSKEAGLDGASMDDDDAYRQVGRFKMGQYFDEYGPEGALVAWYSGPNNAQRWVEGEATDQNGRPWDAPQGNGPSIAGYVNSAMGHFADEKAQAPASDIPQTADYTISGEVSNPNLTDLTEQKLRLLDRDYYNQYGRHFYITSMARNGGGESWHDSAQAFDTADDFLEGNADARNWLIDKAKEYGLYGLDEYSNPSANATGGHLHFSDHGEALNGSGGSYDITVPGFNLSQYDLTPEQEKANMEAAQALISNNEVTPEQQQSVMEMAAQLMNMPVSDDVNEDAYHAAAMQNAIDGGDIGAIFKMHPQETANAMMKSVIAAKAPSPRRAPAAPKIDNINPQASAQTRVSNHYGNRFAQTVDDITKLASQGKIAEAALVARSNGWNNTMVNLLTQGVNASAGNIQNAIMNGIQLDVPNAFPALPEGQGLAGNIKNNQQQISIANLEELASIANNNPQYAAAQATQQNLPITASAIMQSAMNGQPIDGNVLDTAIQQDLNNNQRQANADRQAIDARMQKAGIATTPATPNAGIVVPNGAPAETPDIVIPDTPKRKAPTVNTNDPMARLNDSPVFRQAKAKGDIGTMANEADAMGFHKEAEQIRSSQYGNIPSKFDYKKRLSEVKKMSRPDRIELGKELIEELEAKNIPVNDNLRNDLEHGVPKAIVNAEKKLAKAETNDEAEQEVKPAEEAVSTGNYDKVTTSQNDEYRRFKEARKALDDIAQRVKNGEFDSGKHSQLVKELDNVTDGLTVNERHSNQLDDISFKILMEAKKRYRKAKEKQNSESVNTPVTATKVSPTKVEAKKEGMDLEYNFRQQVKKVRHDYDKEQISYQEAQEKLNAIEKTATNTDFPVEETYTSSNGEEKEYTRKSGVLEEIKHEKEFLENEHRRRHPEIEEKEKQDRIKQENSKYHGFLDNVSPRSRGSIIKTLSKKFLYKDGYMSRKEYAEKIASKPDSSSQLKEYADGKKEYRLFTGDDDAFLPVLKTEYDYFNHLKKQQEVKAEKPAEGDTVLKGVSGIYESDIKDYINRGYNIESYRGHLENGKPVYNLDFETPEDKARFVKDFYGESEEIDTDMNEPDYTNELEEKQAKKPADESNEKATNENKHRTYSYKEREEIIEGFNQKASKIIKDYRAGNITYDEVIDKFDKLEKEIEATDDNAFNPDLYQESKASVLADVRTRKHLAERTHQKEQDGNTPAKPSAPAEEGNKKATNEGETKPQEQKPSKGNLEQSSSQHFDITDYTHTKTGEVFSAAKINGKVDRDTYAKIKDIATKHGGRYNRFAKRFFFKDTGAEGRNAFVAETEREVFGEETKQEEKTTATPNEKVAEAKVQDSNSEAKNTNDESNDENDFHGFLDDKTHFQVALFKKLLLAKFDPFGGSKGYVTHKHLIETLARSNAKVEVKNGRHYINGNKIGKLEYKYFEYLRNNSDGAINGATKVPAEEDAKMEPKKDSIFGEYNEAELYKALGIEAAEDNKSDALHFINQHVIVASVEDAKSSALPDNVPDGIEGTEEERARLREEIRKELNKISANPIFNPRLYMLSAKYVFSYMKSGINDIKKLMTTLKAEFGNDFAKDLAPAVIETIRTYPKDIPFNESHVMAVTKSVGSLYENGTTDLDEITGKITAHMNESAKKKFTPVIEASYNGVKKFFDIKKEADSHGLQQGQSGDADGGHRSVATGASQENEHKEAGEVSRPDGREAGRAVANDDSKDTEKPATGGVRAGSKLEKTGSTGTDSGRNKPAVPLTEAQQNPSATETPGHDYEIKERSANKASAPERFKQNIKAIKLLKQLLADDRMPTPAEQKVLAEYNGWGGLKDAFREGTKENNELKELLSDSEYKAAKASTLDAFYTAPSIVRAIWKGVSRLGFNGGRVLDPAMGIGNFYGCMPRDMMSKSKLYGVEMDELSSQFSKMLYPSAMVENKPFQSAKVADNFFDLVITNVPFSQAKAGGYMIHNFYFANGIDKVRPGGLMVYITSQGSLTGSTDAAKMRNYLAGRADVIGAYKLPEGAFKEAGTDVSVDVVIVRKRDKDNRQSEYAQSALEVKNFNIGYMAAPVNEYFLAHKNHIIGTKAVIGSDAYGNQVLKVKNESGEDVGILLDKAMNDLPKDIYQPINRNNRKTYNTVDAMKRARVDDENIRDLEYYVKDGKLYQNDNGEAVPITGKNAPLVKSYVGIKSTLNSLFIAQRDPDVSDGTLDRLRGELNKRYDAFVKKYGYINDPKNVAKFAKDPSAGTIMALEKITFKGQGKKRTIESVEKADIFTERTMQAIKKVTSAKNPNDALLASLNQLGHVDIDYMAKLLKTKPSQVEQALKGVIYKNPATETYETSDEYLSGNVREKLAQAEMAAEKDPAYKSNVEALKKVQPADLVTDEIIVNLGAPWIPVSDVQAFVDSINSFKAGSLEIGYIPTLAKWTVSGMGRSTKFKADGITLPELLECILNNKSIQVYNGKGKDRVLDSEKTDAANVVADDIKDAFKHWLWQDKERADRLAKFYNENYNNMVLRKYDGAHLDFPGMNAKIHMKPHQKNVVWRMLQNGNTLIAHCVGAGKTFEMQAAGMEMRRLGLANKPLYCVPNNVVEQFAREFRQLYPNAKLLVIKSGSDLPTVRHPKVTTTEDGRKKVIPIDLNEMTKEDRDKLLKARAERNRALARIQTEDWDGIIMSHTMFERLPLSQETLKSYIQEELDMLERTIKQHKGDNLDKRTENALEARKESLENKIDEIMNMDVKDIGIPFEEIGIDQIFVDEADMFKNLHYTTAIGNVSGLTNSNANRSMDMFVKTQYLTRLHDGRGVVFATGTPISNTMAEMYTMMRYLDSRGLKEKGLELFDSWIRTFGEIGTGIERKPSGDGFRKVNKIKNFINMAELTKMFRKFADVKRQEDLNLDIPKLKNDKPTVVALEPDPEIVRYIREVVPKRVADMKKNAYKQKKGADNMLKLTGDLRKMALSDAKIEVCADKIAEVFDRTADVKGAQLVFCDLGIPKAENEKATADTDSDKIVDDDSEGDNASVYDRLMDALKRRGIPDEQIAFVQQAKNKDEQAELFQKVDRGDLRILIGSTARMGAGTNCQHHLVALHDLDAPWRPRDLEQRHGRILRQGNQNSEVEIFNYVIKDSFDANMWEKLKNKASIIAQAMSDNTNLRVVEDADIATLSYAEIEGAATGNPLIKDQLKLNNEVTKYSHASTEFNRKIHTAETQLQTLPEKVAKAEETIAKIERDIKARKSTRGDNFAITLDGKTYTKRADADKALAGINAKLDNVPKEIGSIGGFKIKASLYKADAFAEATPLYQLVKNYSYHTQTKSIAGIENCLAKNPEKAMNQLTNERDRLNRLLEEAKEIVTQKNPYTEKLAELNKKLKDINRQIETAMVDKHYSVSEGISTNRLNDALIKQEVRQAFPTGKVIGYKPNQLQLKLQNDTYVTVKIGDNISKLSDKEQAEARRAHGITQDTKFAITVNGYTNILDYNAVIGLAHNGEDGTIYHEAFHVAYNMALLDEEKTAIEEAFGDEARKAGKDVEEYAADRYREWFISRHKDEKANYNTLFEKIKGTAKSLAELLERIVNGSSEVSRIFSDIESGKIYDRSIDKSHREIDNKIKQRIAELGNRINDNMDFLEVRERLLEDVNHDVQQLYMAYKRADTDELKSSIFNELRRVALDGDKRRKRFTSVYAQHVLRETLQSENRLGEKSRLAESLSDIKRGRYRLYNEHGDQLIIPGEYHDTWNAPEIQRIIKDNPLVDSEGNFKEDTANKGKLIVRYSAKDNNESSRSDKDGFSSTQKYSISEMHTETEPAGSLNRIKKSMSELGKIATEKNVEIRKKKERDIDNLNMLDMWGKTVRQVAKKNNAVKYFYNLARKAYDEQEKLRAHYGEAMKRFNQYTKDKKDLDDVSQVLLQGDMEGKEYKVKDLKEMGLSDNAIRAYKLVRLRLSSAYKLINDARMQVIERNKILHSSQLKDFKKAHFLKDSDIHSIINKGNGKILVTYRGAKIYEHTGEMVSSEELSKLKADKDVCVIDFEPVTDDLGTTLWRVDYTERTKPLTKLTGYVPHFFHKFMVYQKYTNEDGKEILVTRGSGRSLKEAAKLANGYAKENPDSEYVIRAQGFVYDEEYHNVVVGDRDFARMTSQIHKNTDMSLNEARKFLRESAGAKIKGRHRFFGNMKKRKGAEGFEKDVPWLLEHYFNASSRYVAMEHWKPQAISTYERWFGNFNAEPKTDIARYIKNHINDMNGVPSRFEKLLNKSLEKTALGQRLSDYYNGRPALALSSNFSSFIAIVKLGLGNFASAAINFMQLVNIGTKLNSYKWAMEGLKRALKPNKLDRRILKNSGVMNEITLADNSGGYSHNRDSGRVRNVLGNIKRAANKTMLPFTMADSLMRKAAILGAYYQGVTEKGMKPEPGKTISKKAMQYAKEVNFDANFDYSNVATPGVMRAGSVLTQQMFQFQKYPIMQLEFMWNNVVHAENNAQRARFLVPYLLLAGAAGALPFGDLLNEFFSFLFGIYTGKDENLADECKAAMMKWAGNDPASKKLVETVIYGIPALAGIDISGRVGMSGAFSGKYYGTAPSSAAGAIANALGGPVLGTAFNTIDQLHNGNPAEAIKAVSPALGNMIQAWVNGASYGTHHRVNSVYEDGFAKVIHGLGFRSTDESNTSFINSYLYDMRSRYGDEKKDAMDAYRKDKTAENKRAMQDLGITDKQFKRYESDSDKSAQERAQKEWHTKKKPTAKEMQLLHDAKALKDFVQ